MGKANGEKGREGGGNWFLSAERLEMEKNNIANLDWEHRIDLSIRGNHGVQGGYQHGYVI